MLAFLQNHLEVPPYCTAGFKGQNNVKNAEKHIGKREVITMDISHCFPNTKSKYIRKFFADTFGAKDEVLELLVQLTTYNDYLPTGASTSSILLAFAHKEIFDIIYRKVKSHEADVTVYVDDITVSTHKHLGNWIINYINKVLKTHGLWLKKSKTRRFSYKFAEITGIHISQSGKLSAPYRIGHSVVKKLEEKELADMSIKELQSLIAKISYVQEFKPKTMKISKDKLVKQLKKLQKIKDNN